MTQSRRGRGGFSRPLSRVKDLRTKTMRKIATIPHPVSNIVRVMVYATDGGAYLFLYTSLNDGPCEIDE
jgi:hypothetical protein